jgi:hypothetical protein
MITSDKQHHKIGKKKTKKPKNQTTQKTKKKKKKKTTVSPQTKLFSEMLFFF